MLCIFTGIITLKLLLFLQLRGETTIHAAIIPHRTHRHTLRHAQIHLSTQHQAIHLLKIMFQRFNSCKILSFSLIHCTKLVARHGLENLALLRERK